MKMNTNVHDHRPTPFAHSHDALMQNRTPLEIQGQEEEVGSSSGSDNTKSIIFGGTDGVFHSLSLVAAAAGADLSSNVVIVLGFATVAAGAVAK